MSTAEGGRHHIKKLTIDNREVPYIDVGAGELLVCVHGSISDYRVWDTVVSRLSAHYRVVAMSLRHYFPETWNGENTFTISQHVDDVASFISAVGGARVNLMGHSRGGHIAFRVCQKYPELVSRAVLVEPGGSFQAEAESVPTNPSELLQLTTKMSEIIRAGKVDEGLSRFLSAFDGEEAWGAWPEEIRQRARDNASTLLAQPSEGRRPFTAVELEKMKIPTLLVIGRETPGFMPALSRTLAQHLPNGREVTIPGTHHMFRQEPERFCEVVHSFLDS